MIPSVISIRNVNEHLLRTVLSELVLYNYVAYSYSSVSKKKSKPAVQYKWTEPKGYDTNIFIHNPLSKDKTKLILQNENVVKWYSCGPTVYDSAHIGHASCYVKLDIIRRILMDVFEINVFYLMGVTDIDNKIILRSNETKEDFRILAQRYETEFFKDLEKLNVLSPTMTVKVSDHIPEIISFVDTIVSRNQGYRASSGSVYFSTEHFPGYGKLRQPQLSDTPEKPNPEKCSPLDFTLWKAAKPGEPSWQSPWGPGRPGWHIECSAMASKILGPQLDIHSGGQDLIFPHHENEEAQSCAYHNTTQWVNYWLHTGHLHMKGDVKMSKSLKNTISISELLEKHTSNHFRMLCLLSPYRHRIEYSSETLSVAEGTFRRLTSFMDECKLYLSGVKKTGVIDESAVIKNIAETRTAVRTYLADDFDTPRAVDELLRFVSQINAMLSQPATESTPRSPVAVAAASHFLQHTLTQLGFTFAFHADSGEGDTSRLSAVLEAALTLRSSVREVALQPEMAATVKPQRNQLLQDCDRLRKSLSDAGVEVKDHGSQKSTWSLKDIVSHKPD